jgi:hypothetical protein
VIHETSLKLNIDTELIRGMELILKKLSH